MVHFDKLNDLEKRMLLDACFYFMPMEMRHQLMFLLPHVYNKAVGQEVMGVVNMAFEKDKEK